MLVMNQLSRDTATEYEPGKKNNNGTSKKRAEVTQVIGLMLPNRAAGWFRQRADVFGFVEFNPHGDRLPKKKTMSLFNKAPVNIMDSGRQASTNTKATSVSTRLAPLNVSPGEPWSLQCAVQTTGSDVYIGIAVYKLSVGGTFFVPIASGTATGQTFISTLNLLFRASLSWNADQSTITLSVNSFQNADQGIYRCSLKLKDNPVPINDDKTFPAGIDVTVGSETSTPTTTTTRPTTESSTRLSTTTTPVVTTTSTTTLTSTASTVSTSTRSPTNTVNTVNSSTTNTLSTAKTSLRTGYSTERGDLIYLVWLIPLLVILLILIFLCLWCLLCFRTRKRKKVKPTEKEKANNEAKPVIIQSKSHTISQQTWCVGASSVKDQDGDVESGLTNRTPRRLKPLKPVETTSQPIDKQALLIGVTSGQERQPGETEEKGDNQGKVTENVEAKPNTDRFINLGDIDNGASSDQTTEASTGVIISTLNGPYMTTGDNTATVKGTPIKERKRRHKKKKKHKARKGRDKEKGDPEGEDERMVAGSAENGICRELPRPSWPSNF
ncbi:mucin-5AC-like [Gigantopelta aegis]|uniref:mucin-5AC-like n=1 Tax=Gigantopelta aegis TaxID=1735272 RepID=UPI001B888859|nr:mucin-5AC-like [Gigantopelta aegis]